MEKGRIVLLGNAGIVLIYKKTRIIIDGLYKDLRDYFTDLPPKVWQLMQEGKGDLANAEYIFFTHSHFDHYYSPYFMAYMKRNSVQGLLLPPMDNTEGLEAAYAQYGKYQLVLDNKNEIQLAPGLTLKILTIRHVDKLYHHIPVECMLFTVEGKRILILSDADYELDAYKQLTGLELDYVFVTPIFYNNKLGRDILYNYLKAKKIVVYHLPSPQDDKYNYYSMVTRDIEKYAEGDEVIVWNHFGQYVTF